jgi:hypothetical protein
VNWPPLEDEHGAKDLSYSTVRDYVGTMSTEIGAEATKLGDRARRAGYDREARPVHIQHPRDRGRR